MQNGQLDCMMVIFKNQMQCFLIISLKALGVHLALPGCPAVPMGQSMDIQLAPGSADWASMEPSMDVQLPS
jgi:hypothetical protein